MLLYLPTFKSAVHSRASCWIDTAAKMVYHAASWRSDMDVEATVLVLLGLMQLPTISHGWWLPFRRLKKMLRS